MAARRAHFPLAVDQREQKLEKRSKYSPVESSSVFFMLQQKRVHRRVKSRALLNYSTT
jgi:hypothetical protein